MTNNVKLVGVVKSGLSYSYVKCGETFYNLYLSVLRKSGNSDILPVAVSEHTLRGLKLNDGDLVGIIGELRSHNSYDHKKVHLKLEIFCNSIELIYSNEPVNDAFLDGTIAKNPTLRVTPMGRELSDFQLDIKRRYNRYDHIPCIAWGRSAEYISSLPAGTEIRVSGRIQSREYVKNGLIHTAYELSVNLVEVVSY